MTVLSYLVPFVIALGGLIFFHELGHYLVARACGVKVLRFSIGFGPALWSRRLGRDGTEWVLAAVPLGGYVKMLDEREGAVAPEDLPRAFNRQPVGKRMSIVAAGPAANLLLAIALYVVLYTVGVREPVARIDPPAESLAARVGLLSGDRVLAVDGRAVASLPQLRWEVLAAAMRRNEVALEVERAGERLVFSLPLTGVVVDHGNDDVMVQLGLVPWRPPLEPVVGSVAPGSPAERAGIVPGMRVRAIEGKEIADWRELVEIVRAHPGETLRFTLEYDGVVTEREVFAEPTDDGQGGTIGRIGVAVRPPSDETFLVSVRYPPIQAAGMALRQTWEVSTMTLRLFGRMLLGEASLKNLSGPLTIADYAGQTARMGLEHYLRFVALVSISLGVLNLLPVPILDGGHLLYYSLEAVRGRPLSERAMEIGQQIGLALLLTLMAIALFNDVSRIWSSVSG
ncbi:RIP metalloprotease RseP [Tepidiphilus baoligensis]|uniref:Zinc metalloprotease n=1 Tax=Tepidiphilus baoligensis TaxID=2698687 RepID=A0ABX1QMF2_9PROT|nr:RIP metalloprotease RseP [Tepidiphilus baoligensis]NMH16333.1 RIP metalloprotease RseP [Tepidiphilus baoligensis]